ncbi:hypothetical protein, variant [Fonticula alba]|uniref:Uncharacterized protein n=1 Tax=Fonticula alba TaxID=691883 RepID=A0A058Z1M1_FONAL|nr:hypothetical protein, variant [Fonticula alba]KCV68160.1 hypothetical protein, variant [Fonticula alba]|eukprot:XP_009497214.1 hypothetical protein, variant [Fonticula alba]
MVLPPPLTILIWADVNRPAEVLELQAGLPDAQQKFLDFLLPGVLYLSRAGCARLAGLAGAPGHPSTGSGGEFMPLLVSPNGQDFFRLRPAPEGFHPEDRTDTYDVLLHPSDRTRLAGQASTAQLTVARSCGLPPGVALVRLAIQLERGVQLDESTIEGLTACLEGVVLRAGQMYYLRKCHFLVQELVDSAGALLRQGIFQSTMPPNSLLAYTAVSAYGLPVPSLRPAIQVSVAGVASSPEHLWLAVLPASRPAGGSPHPTLTPSPCAPTPQGALSPGPRPMADAFLAPSTLQRIQRLAGGRVPGSATGACLSTTHEPLSILPDGRVPRQSIRLSPKLQAALGTANASTGFRGKILFQHQLPAVGLLVLCPTGAFHPGHLDAQAAPPSVEASVEAFLSQCDGLFVQQDDIVTLPGPVECRVVEMFRYPCRRPLASGRLVRSTPGSPISEVVVLSRRSGASLPREPGPEHRSELGRRTLQLLCPGAVQVELALALVSAATMASPCSPGECLAPAGLLSGLHAGLLAGDLFLASPDGSVRLRVRYGPSTRPSRHAASSGCLTRD